LKVVGLITEYNPFHNGHLYHIEEAKRLTDADYAVIVMSGDFVQRGEPAIIDKYHRTKMGLMNGGDLILELPSILACSSAEYFASAGVALLDKLGIIDYLCFGSESGDVNLLYHIAKILVDETEEFQDYLSGYLKEGMAFPLARSKALIAYYYAQTNISDDFIRTVETVISSPNNILGIEYMKALIKRKSNMKPVTISRVSAGYHDKMLNTSVRDALYHKNISSASAIRKALLQEVTPESFCTQIPENVLDLLMTNYNINFPVTEDDFSGLLHYKLIMNDSYSLQEYADVSPSLADRIMNHLPSYKSFSSFCELVKTKNVTSTRIRRILLHILLEIKKAQVDYSCRKDFVQYARILGFKKKSTSLLSEMKRNSRIPLITKLTQAKSILSPSDLEMLNMDIKSSEIYHSVVLQKYGGKQYNEFTKEIIII